VKILLVKVNKKIYEDYYWRVAPHTLFKKKTC